jgi:hypothetical protein
MPMTIKLETGNSGVQKRREDTLQVLILHRSGRATSLFRFIKQVKTALPTLPAVRLAS